MFSPASKIGALLNGLVNCKYHFHYNNKAPIDVHLLITHALLKRRYKP